MNNYYVLTPNGCSEVEESVFLSMMAKRKCEDYIDKVYRGELEIDNIPEEHQETVRSKVEERIEQYGRFEDGSISASDTLIAIHKLSSPKLTRGEAKALFSGIEKLRDGATDAVASTAVSVYPHLKEDGSLVTAGTRINWNGILKRAAVDLWDAIENNPDNAPTLWEDINYREGYRIIPETITTGTLFAKDECGWWDDTLYVSLIDNNVWNPTQYPAGWSVFEEN